MAINHGLCSGDTDCSLAQVSSEEAVAAARPIQDGSTPCLLTQEAGA